MNTPGLYLATLETKLAAAAAGEPQPLYASRWGRRFFWGMVAGMLWTSAAPALLSPSFTLNIVLVVGLVIEVVGIIGVAILQVRETRRSPAAGAISLLGVKTFEETLAIERAQDRAVIPPLLQIARYEVARPLGNLKPHLHAHGTLGQ